MAKAKVMRETVEGGDFRFPYPETITLYTENHEKLKDKVVGDNVSLEITARITEYDEAGRYRLELSDIDIVDKTAKDKLIEKATSEVVHLGSLSPDSLESIFSASQKEKEE